VVILNWNGAKLLAEFLPSVVEHSNEAEIVVIDNGSTDDSLVLLAERFAQVKIVKLDKNYGFASGYNRGLKDLDHEIFVLLNSLAERGDGSINGDIHFVVVEFLTRPKKTRDNTTKPQMCFGPVAPLFSYVVPSSNYSVASTKISLPTWKKSIYAGVLSKQHTKWPVFPNRKPITSVELRSIKAVPKRPS